MVVSSCLGIVAAESRLCANGQKNLGAGSARRFVRTMKESLYHAVLTGIYFNLKKKNHG